MRTIIRNGYIGLTPDTLIQADLGIVQGSVYYIGRDVNRQDYDVELDASGCWVLPGGIDPHVHLDWDFGDTVTTDDMGSGTKAAVFGGTTTVMNFIQPQPGESLPALVERWKEKSGASWAHYGFHIIIPEMNDQWLKELALLPSLGVHTIKVFTAYPGKLMLSDADIYKVLRTAGHSGVMTMVHAENGPVIDVIAEDAIMAGHYQAGYHGITRPAELEGEAVFRVGQLARLAKAAAYIVHMSSHEAVQALAFARQLGANLAAETCPQYLFLDDQVYEPDSFSVARFVYTPPSRSLKDQEVLWTALKRRDIGIVSSDHCPFDMEGAKQLGIHDFRQIPNGGPGIETRVPLLLNAVQRKEIDLGSTVGWMSTHAAKTFGLFPYKGALLPGSDADIIIVDPQRVPPPIHVEQLHQRVDYTPYEGWAVRGFPRDVMVGGQWAIRDYQSTGQPPNGQFIGFQHAAVRA
ncbi:dihydropyrimidinase [Sulfobacillus sp. hq2]|uniref:dihydropyrimidinase n=1 Tax=Sulfobacillus TaxID=28033 RepID=UPI000CD03043|nr:dihydropyrimidinase [Sulfobacillus sp. hq2]POB09582.1 dihydropyrimidinase [Sulfobacillus sp. hq2]